MYLCLCQDYSTKGWILSGVDHNQDNHISKLHPLSWYIASNWRFVFGWIGVNALIKVRMRQLDFSIFLQHDWLELFYSLAIKFMDYSSVKNKGVYFVHRKSFCHLTKHRHKERHKMWPKRNQNWIFKPTVCSALGLWIFI